MIFINDLDIVHQFFTYSNFHLADIIIYIKQILQRQMSQEKGKTTLKFPCL